ncbi:heme biosynthesis protein HemY [Xylella fastidiosa]|uniref:Heme biosynthesis protein HemY n=1 Tax=Xylella fastidiosa subsp. multiplex TaxID=644357 RepID=A0A9Q4QTI3_XYLFS|nr:heme biosynthesis HemY N-terminal domain-containing protein [Xylella fastidiosa]ERI59687.1 porphyrin biosynthesis protein [Xylella fastidiosa subsp. multiplex Griffin-1]ACA12172.1 porphyrin biosynthesis protein [Xylella fastidiosa M12]KAJ4851907.1 heme biosynthesis protein HemY [Xylella fastidiosa subsp. multiplex]KFA40482.1 porphyrin biosynthesis protein [Xylella fastidiosa]MBE0268582.1 heme biosynthesis protein HemY [Xylella fastidiosa subsp. multiplex]
MNILRNLALWFFLLILGIFSAQWLLQQPNRDFGDVVIRIGGNDYITTVPQATILLLIIVLLLWSLRSLLVLPIRIWKRYKYKQGHTHLIEGLRNVDHGYWQLAERLLIAASEDEDTEVSAIALTTAIRMADMRGDFDTANVLTNKLAKQDPTTHALLQSERLLALQRPNDAINVLDALETHPLPPRGLLIRARTLIQIGRADEAYSYLGTLREQRLLSDPEYVRFENETIENVLRQAKDANVLTEHWEALPQALKTHPNIVGTYAIRATVLHLENAAMLSLEQTLERSWDENLIRLYGFLPLKEYQTRQNRAEHWLTLHPDSPNLLLTLGRLALQRQQYSQAETFLRRAIDKETSAETWEELGHNYAAQGDTVHAQECYANALLLYHPPSS